MSGSAVATMVVGVGIVWGSLIASILHAVRTGRAARRESGRPDT